MRHKINALFLVGKAAYFLGVLLLFNFFFGLLFFRFFYWLLIAGTLFILFITALFIGKNILFRPFKTDTQFKTSTDEQKDVIDVEAEVFDDHRGNA